MSDGGSDAHANPGVPAATPAIAFDPALLADPAIPKSIVSSDQAMVDGVREHLRRYGGHQALRTALGRLEDPLWLAAWCDALKSVAGKKLLFRGSELGVLALEALEHNGARALIVERSAAEARLAGGIVQKHYLKRWHSQHKKAVDSWSEEQRRLSFADFTTEVDILPADSERLRDAQCDCLVFPHIDHSLLGTGIVRAVREYRGGALAPGAGVLPGAARIFAAAVQWKYTATAFRLAAMSELRWSLTPQPLTAPPESWVELTRPALMGELDFSNFSETEWRLELPVVSDGTVDGIVFWFDLTCGGVHLCNAPDGAVRCLRPAVQYTDRIAVRAGESLSVHVRVHETRLQFQVLSAPPRQVRHCLLPSWYVPMLQDAVRNRAYERAIDTAVKSTPQAAVFDIGTGCGILSMMAAASGASRVTGCEVNPHIARVAQKIVAENGLAERVHIINKDCRNTVLGQDLPERASLAVFEMFDCSLIGEGILHFLAYARENLLAANARYIPMSGRLRAVGIECRLDNLRGFDVNLLNPYRFSSSFLNVDAGQLQWRALTDPCEIFSFDFSKATPQAEQKSLRIPVIREGTIGAMLFWFDLQVEEGCWLSNDPAANSTLHWKQGLQWLPEVSVGPGMQLPVVAAHDGSSLRFRWESDALPKEAFSRLPRFDPHWWKEYTDLVRQTHDMLGHCMRHPEEYVKLAALAQCLAIDPGAHDLDPAVAQRFAAAFFTH